ncbi:nucleotidyltransferase [Geomonas sp. Red276]
MLTTQDIDNLRDTIIERLRPQRIFLFGSYADGRATEESDIDLLVVMESPLSHHQRNVALKRLFPHRCFSLDAFVYTPEEFSKYRDVPGTVVYSATHDGKVIYG